MNYNNQLYLFLGIIFLCLVGILYLEDVYAERNISYSKNFQQSMEYSPEYHGASSSHNEVYDFDSGYFKNYDYYFDSSEYVYDNHAVKIFDYNRGQVQIIQYHDQYVYIADDGFLYTEDFETKYYVCTYVNWC